MWIRKKTGQWQIHRCPYLTKSYGRDQERIQGMEEKSEKTSGIYDKTNEYSGK